MSGEGEEFLWIVNSYCGKPRKMSPISLKGTLSVGL